MPIPVLSRLSNGLARKRGNATRVYDGSSRVAYTTRDLADAHAITRNHKTQREDQCVSAGSLAPLGMTCAGNALGSKRATGASEKLRPEAPGSGSICGAT